MKRLTTALTASSMASARVCFLTDIEGNWQYVRNFVRQSTCLRFRDAHERELELQDDCMLVFGGDAGDKGDDTLHCYGELLRLKKQHPDRVVLLVGNRDVNKMRFTSELSDSELDLRTMATEIRDGPVWVPIDKRMTLTKFLTKKQAEKASKEQTCQASLNDELLLDTVSSADVNTKINRLHYMLSHTMGSDGDFERRRKELQDATHSSSSSSAVADEDVVQSFVDSVADGGVIREFLLQGCLAYIAHGTLFVHGGLINPQASTGSNPEDSQATNVLGRIPGDPHVYQDVHEWTRRLNGWYQQQLQEWIHQPTWNEDKTSRGGHELMNYVLPSYRHSVIMGRHLDKAGMPVALPMAVAETLRASAITRAIVGHTPHGTCPTVIPQPQPLPQNKTVNEEAEEKVDQHPFQEVVMCDTSYSDMKAPDNRGIAASELVLHADGRLDVHGVLENGKRIAYSTTTTTTTDTSNSIIGRLLRDGTRVKAKLAESEADGQDQFLVFKVEKGFSYTYDMRSFSELETIGFVDENAVE